DKVSEFAGRAVHEWSAEVFSAVGGPVLSGQYRLMIRTEREKASERKKYDEVEIRPYTDDELAAIDATYAAEQRRGAEPRWWEDVAEGDEVGPIVKGPLRVTDMVVWHSGVGMGLYGVKALRLAWQQRQRVPRFFTPDDLNIPDVQQRVHWDAEWAKRAGNPAIYDYGRMRETWLIHLCTDWMGDDAWLWKLDCEFRKFNYVGDTHWMRGRVTRRHLSEAGPAVDLDVWGENQRGETTTPGHATILLPSREHGEVRLPDPPGGATNCAEALAGLTERFSHEEDGA
ncbi:MAG: acyl dehydratase, partial [Actinomycetia bacterium]|nr:acyl dehydratase [Actinomycetes bacterium]